jgi:hypothetical protein
MDGARVWIGVAVAAVLVAGGGVAGFVIGGEKSEPAPATAEPTTVERTVTEERVVRRDVDRKPNRRDPWPGNGYRMVGIEPGKPVPVRDAPSGETLKRFDDRTEFGGPRVLWVAKRRGPWLGVVAPEIGNNRLGWIRFDRERLRFGTTSYSMQVDLTDRVVELRRGDQVLKRVVVSVGRIGSGTPPGRFAVTDVITRGLSEVYGCCAIALSARQPNLPPGWIGGDRIAVHGWSGPVGEAASGGCLRASDGDMRWLADRVPLGTPVFVET